jgi:hypothetical protein
VQHAGLGDPGDRDVARLGERLRVAVAARRPGIGLEPGDGEACVRVGLALLRGEVLVEASLMSWSALRTVIAEPSASSTFAWREKMAMPGPIDACATSTGAMLP